jgi:hypothetical protein
MTNTTTTTSTRSMKIGSDDLRMPIDDVFFITGRGVVAVGVVEAGTVSVGDDIEVERGGTTVARATVTGVEMFRKLVDAAKVGDHVGLLLSDVKKEDLQRGMVITAAGAMSVSFGSSTGKPVTVDGVPVTTTFGSTSTDGGASVQFSTFGAPVVDSLSKAAASAADDKDFTKGQEFRGLGFTDDSTPGHVGSRSKKLTGLVIVLLLVIASVAATFKMVGIF